VATIGTFIDGWNDHCHPFTSTKTADQIRYRCVARIMRGVTNVVLALLCR
jgi:hypothetical protein